MSVSLGATWNPRGEWARFERLLPVLVSAYKQMVIVFPPVADPIELASFKQRSLAAHPQVLVKRPREWAAGRYTAVAGAVDSGADYVHYADMDRLLRQVETRPDGWSESLAFLQTQDVTIFGRPVADYASHPRALVETEASSNAVTSYLLGRPDVIDVSAGSKGFSRRAAEFLLEHCTPAYALGADAEWPVTLHRGGFKIVYREVAGLDWESADRYRQEAADAETQRRAATEYDSDPENWSRRAAVAREVIERGLIAARRNLDNETPAL